MVDRLRIMGKPRSGTSAWANVIEQAFGADVEMRGKHRPQPKYDDPVVLVVKHPAAWVASYHNWKGDGSLDDWEWVLHRVHHWASFLYAVTKVAEDHTVLTHYQLLTNPKRALMDVSRDLGLQEPNGFEVPKHRASNQATGTFDPTRYTEGLFWNDYGEYPRDRFRLLLESDWYMETLGETGAQKPGLMETRLPTPRTTR